MNVNLTLFGQLISFAVFVWFCMKFVWPPIVAAMAEREQKIADGLQAASSAEKKLELAQQKALSQMGDAKAEAAGIVEQANKRASSIIDEAKVQAVVEADRIKKAAGSDVEQQVSKARDELRAQVSVLAVQGAEKILKASVDANAHQQMLNDLAAEL